jgi:hypothetical protein
LREVLRRAFVVAVATAMLSAIVGTASATKADVNKHELIQRADSELPAATAGALPKGTTVTVKGASGVISNAKSGQARLTADDAANSVVRKRSDGVQALTVLRTGSTATYTLDLPKGQMVKRDAGGGLRITDSTGAVFYGAVKAPWALDAKGKQLKTSYSLRGDKIVQRVDTANAAYPIVADPWLSFGWFVYVNFTKGEVRWLAGYADYYQLAAVACGLIPVPWVAVACGVAVGWMAINFGNTVKTAARYGQCVNVRVGYNGGIYGWGRFSC